MKRCARCGDSKPADQFPRNKRTRDGLYAYCKSCNCAKQADWMERNPLGAATYRAANRDKINARKRELRSNREHCRRRNLKEKHGMTMEDYQFLAVAQRHACAICGHRPVEPEVLHVDHDHRTGAKRGLLCGPCNKGIGLLKDDPDIVLAAAMYLRLSAGTEFLVKEFDRLEGSETK